MAFKTLHGMVMSTLWLTSSYSPLRSLLQPHWPPFSFLNTLSSSPPQSFAFADFFFFFLELSHSGTSHGRLLLNIQVTAQISSSQRKTIPLFLLQSLSLMSPCFIFLVFITYWVQIFCPIFKKAKEIKMFLILDNSHSELTAATSILEFQWLDTTKLVLTHVTVLCWVEIVGMGPGEGVSGLLLLLVHSDLFWVFEDFCLCCCQSSPCLLIRSMTASFCPRWVASPGPLMCSQTTLYHYWG